MSVIGLARAGLPQRATGGPPNSGPIQANHAIQHTNTNTATPTKQDKPPATHGPARPISASGRATQGLAGYRIIRSIGRGKFGVCQLVESKSTGKLYVLKCIALQDQSERERLLALQEVETLKRLQQPKAHPFIVKYHENFLYQDGLYVVMQWCSGGDLHHFLRDRKATGVYLEETVIIDWLIQLLLAIRRCHELKIIHRDIKSQNIFLVPSSSSPAQQARDAATAAAATAAATKAGFPLTTHSNADSSPNTPTPPLPPVAYSIKLGDFGISKILNSTGELAMSVVGTPYSMSPEVCENKPYSFASDVWALGCVLYEVCTLKHAFDSNNLLGLVWKIVQEAYPPIPELYSQDLRELVSAMLAKDPQARPTVEQILDLKFIKRRLKVQIQEKLRERNARRASRQGGGAGGSSPTPYSQQEESTQNIFDNQMSVSYAEGSQDEEEEEDEEGEDDGDEEDDEDECGDDDDGGGDDSVGHGDVDSTAGENGGSRLSFDAAGRDDEYMGDDQFSRTNSLAHFSKSIAPPNTRPAVHVFPPRSPHAGQSAAVSSSSRSSAAAAGASASPKHFFPAVSSSPKALSPSNAQQMAAAAAKSKHQPQPPSQPQPHPHLTRHSSRDESNSDSDRDVDTQDLLRSVRISGGRRPSSDESHSGASSGTSSYRQSFKVNMFPAAVAAGLASGSAKRIATNVDHRYEDNLSPSHYKSNLFLGSGLASGSAKRLVHIDLDDQSPSSSSSPFGTGSGIDSLVLGRAGSRRANPFASALSPSSGGGGSGDRRASDIAVHQNRPAAMTPRARAGSNFVSPTSHSNNQRPFDRPSRLSVAPNTSEDCDISSPRTPGSFALQNDGRARTKEQLKAQIRASTRIATIPSEDGDVDGEIAIALGRRHINDHNGRDGLGESDPDDDRSDDSDANEDMVIEQLQSQLHEAGDPEAEGDSPIFMLPESSDEEGEPDSDQDDDDSNGVHPPPNLILPPISPKIIQPPPPGLASHRNSLQPLPHSAKSKAAALLAAASHPSISPSSPRSSITVPMIQPSLRDKFAAVKDRCLRSMDSACFDEIYAHFQRSHLLSPRGASNIVSPKPSVSQSSAFSYQRATSPAAENLSIRAVRDMLRQTGHAKYAEVSADLIFSIEQLVYLQQVIAARTAAK